MFKLFRNRYVPRTQIDQAYVDANWHEDVIIHMAKLCKPQVYVELGLYQCHLFNRMTRHADHLVGVDVEDVSTYVKTSPNITVIQSTTDQYAKNLRDSPIQIDMLFIDADHSKEAVLADFKNFFPFVRPHGLIFLHDTHPKDLEATRRNVCNDCFMAVEELSKNTTEYELLTIPIHPGLTVCRKRNTQLSWSN